MKEAIAKVIRDLRTKHNISQEKLAEAIDSHQVYISEIEQAKKLPSLSVLYRIAKYFDMTLSQLVKKIEKELGVK